MMWDGTYESKISRPKTSSSSRHVSKTASSLQPSSGTNILPGLRHLRRVYQLPETGISGELIYHELEGRIFVYSNRRGWTKLSSEFVRTCQKSEELKKLAERRTIADKINQKFKEDGEKRRAELLQRSVITREEIRQEYNLPAVITSEIPLKKRLDFWNYPDWNKAGNLRDGGQPFWMFDNVEQPPEPVPEPPKPTHRLVSKKVGRTTIQVMEKIVD